MEREQDLISLDTAPTLAEVFHERVLRTPNATAYHDYRAGRWQDFSWQETQDEVALWQNRMLDDGLQAGDRIAIMSSNNWDWVVCDQAAQGLGLVSVPIYTNDRADNIAWILADSGARWLLVENVAQWRQLEDIQELLLKLQRIVTLEPVNSHMLNVQLVHDWLAPARCTEPTPAYQLNAVPPTTLATIVYTSGTTGRPKGVMLSHQNLLWDIQAALRAVKVYPSDRLLSFLPLSHTLERTAGYYLPIVSGSTVAFSRGIPKLAEDLLEIRPTLMVSVPRIFERVYARITDKINAGSSFRRRLFNKAMELGWRHFEMGQKRASWTPSLVLRPLLDHLVGTKVRARLGGRLRLTICGGAALNEEVSRFFIGLGIPILQGYGLTETSPVISVNRLEDNLPVSVGTPLPGIEVRLGKHDELLTRSPSVMLGYWNNPDATHSVIDSDGWLHTGDKATLDNEGHIRITGRLKEIIVLSNGEKVPPGDMESAIVLDELVDQVMVIGEGRPYLSALIVPNTERLERIAEKLHLNPANQHFYDDDRLHLVLLQHIEQRTLKFPGYARIRQVALVPQPWTPDNGLMTPTLKLRRERILDQCQKETEELYAGH